MNLAVQNIIASLEHKVLRRRYDVIIGPRLPLSIAHQAQYRSISLDIHPIYRSALPNTA